MSVALYNDIDPFVCDWLENLIVADHLPAGVVDRRSIVDVDPSRYTAFHTFAGIEVWPHARLDDLYEH